MTVKADEIQQRILSVFCFDLRYIKSNPDQQVKCFVHSCYLRELEHNIRGG